MPPARVTMADVAAAAEVSTASVSRVLSGRRPVSGAVAERVRRAAAELGYEVDAVGRSLRTRSTRTVGLVVADVVNPFFPALIQAVETAVAAAGHGVLLADAGDDPGRERDAVQRLLARRVDALVVTPVGRVRSRAVVAAAATQVPVVQLDRQATPRAHYVGVDNEGAVTAVLDHVASAGARHPTFVGPDPRISTGWERQRAFVRSAGRLDASAPERVLVGAFSREWGRAAVPEILRRWPRTDAVVCADDLIALGVLDGLAAAGVRVPQDVVVVGFDDTLVASVVSPALTSVRQPLAAMARTAVELVLAGRTSPHRAVRLPAAVVPRASTDRSRLSPAGAPAATP